MTNAPKTPGRGFFTFIDHAEKMAFAAYVKERIREHGGRNTVSAKTGISEDSLSKWSSGRAVPSRMNVEKLCTYGLFIDDQCATPEDLMAISPWMTSRFRAAARLKPAVNTKVPDAPEPKPPTPNLLDVILHEPGLTTKQRMQLTALTTLVLSGVNVEVSVRPKE